jgi:hypothetical protein
MQSTGQTSVQLMSLTPMQGSLITYVMARTVARLFAELGELERPAANARAPRLMHAPAR